MKALVLALLLAGCWRAEPAPVLYNRAEPSLAERVVPFTRKQKNWWRDECVKTYSNPVCYVLTVPSGGLMKCGCCPYNMSIWQCTRLF